ncbi:recombinase family protein, partial [Bacillus sp. 166amftsu]
MYTFSICYKTRDILVKYGYARVSTLNQDLESQIQMLEKEGCE